MRPYVLTWGGGDLATGVAIRLHRVGIRVLVVEAFQPMAVRRSVAFAQAVFDGEISIENVQGKLIETTHQMKACWDANQVPVLVDPQLSLWANFRPLVLVDARMRKTKGSLPLDKTELVIGLGPGFVVGENCHAAIETNRGHFLGRVYWQGETQADTGIPGKVEKYAQERVLHTPEAGQVETFVEIGDGVNAGDLMLRVDDYEIRAPFTGIVRGLIHHGLHVEAGTKVGDIDPRLDNFRCWYISEKSLAIGGGVLEAVLTKPEIRSRLWD
jgi:xanthine dehydrogenase accessory factor